MSELKRCPFCGGEAEILEHDNGWAIWHCIMCKNCKASQEWRKGYTKEEAIKAWNTRKPMERILERLEECKETHDRRLLSKKETASFKIKELQFSGCYQNAIEIVKEEGGVE